MYFDDGSYPWSNTENFIKIFDWNFVRSSSTILLPVTITVAIILPFSILMLRNLLH